jgi:hypothetical protein
MLTFTCRSVQQTKFVGFCGFLAFCLGLGVVEKESKVANCC